MKYTKYEMARIIGARALQITMGSPLLIKITEEFLQKINFNPIEIAKEEFKKGILPITIKRPLPKRFIASV
ncbi:MAG: DNA-directed RNA polymerase subunit K [Nanoarchaeota archaeon]